MNYFYNNSPHIHPEELILKVSNGALQLIEKLEAEAKRADNAEKEAIKQFEGWSAGHQVDLKYWKDRAQVLERALKFASMSLCMTCTVACETNEDCGGNDYQFDQDRFAEANDE
jgi:hypothetical protein